MNVHQGKFRFLFLQNTSQRVCVIHVTVCVCVQVDEYPVLKKDWNDILPANADTRLDNPKNIYLGRTRKCFISFLFSFLFFIFFSDT